MKLHRHISILSAFLVAVVALILSAAAAPEAAAQKKIPFGEARIFIEFNETANDAGFHVFLDAEDWKEIEIRSPNGRTIFEVEGQGGFGNLGMTELFFEGAEPSLNDVPLSELLALFPEGEYTFIGKTVEGKTLLSKARLSHTVPAGPTNVAAKLEGDSLVISWTAVTEPAKGFPDRDIEIAGYQVIVEEFQVTVPASITKVTVSPEFVSSLEKGENLFEVLAIEANGNQTITESSFKK